jgi:hypothetical protein
MAGWWGAAGVIVAYNAWAKRNGKPYACDHLRALDLMDKTMAVSAYLWLGAHVFVKPVINRKRTK